MTLFVLACGKIATSALVNFSLAAYTKRLAGVWVTMGWSSSPGLDRVKNWLTNNAKPLCNGGKFANDFKVSDFQLMRSLTQEQGPLESPFSAAVITALTVKVGPLDGPAQALDLLERWSKWNQEQKSLRVHHTETTG
jgi:hypothetical protein